MVQTSSSIKASLDSLTKKGFLFKTLKGAYKFSDTYGAYAYDLIGFLYAFLGLGLCSAVVCFDLAQLNHLYSKLP